MIATKVPEFGRMPAWKYKTTDFLTSTGAEVLCRIIEKAWAEIGHPEIRADAVPVPASKDHSSHYAIRIHGLINGVPRQ